MLGLLKPCYVTFNKTEFAGLCARLAQSWYHHHENLNNFFNLIFSSCNRRK